MIASRVFPVIHISHGILFQMQYHDEGYLPDALINYLVRLGWAYKNQEIFSRDEMIFISAHYNTPQGVLSRGLKK